MHSAVQVKERFNYVVLSGCNRENKSIEVEHFGHIRSCDTNCICIKYLVKKMN